MNGDRACIVTCIVSPLKLTGPVRKKFGESRKNHVIFNKNKVKTWWISKNVVTLHPLFVALCPK